MEIRSARAAVCLLGLGLGGCYLAHERGDPPGESECGVALLPGSPAPMPGYCPSRANRSIFAIAGRAPALRWQLELPEEAGTHAAIVVGPGGRLYVAAGSALFAIDDGGASARVAWRADLGAAASAPVLLADGSVLVVARRGASREAVWLTEAGEVSRRAALPDGLAGHPLVGERGALFFYATAASGTSTLVALEPTGALRWSRELGGAVSALALAPGDHLVAGELLVTDEPSPTRDGWLRTELRLVSVDGASGEEDYHLTLDRDGALTAGPAVGPDGSVNVVAWIDGYRQSALFSVTPDGGVRRTLLPDPPIGGGPSTLAVRSDGGVVLKEGTGLLAYDALGSLRWRREVHLNIDLGGTIDPAGDVLSGHGVLGGDTGEERWVSEIPVHREGGTFFFPGPIVVGDEVLYYMAADDQLWAVGEPL